MINCITSNAKTWFVCFVHKIYRVTTITLNFKIIVLKIFSIVHGPWVLYLYFVCQRPFTYFVDHWSHCIWIKSKFVNKRSNRKCNSKPRVCDGKWQHHHYYHFWFSMTNDDSDTKQRTWYEEKYNDSFASQLKLCKYWIRLYINVFATCTLLFIVLFSLDANWRRY